MSFALTCDVTHAPGALYEATGDLGHLNEHLALLDHALKVLPPEDPNLGPVHTNIASGQLQRFCRLGDPDDLTSAVAAARRGVKASRPDDPNVAVRHSNLAGALRMLHGLNGDPEVLDESIAAGRAAIAAVTPATNGEPLIFASLAGSLQYRGLRTSSRTDLEESIELARRAMAIAPPASPHRPAAANILAASLRARAELTGDVSSLSEAIALNRETADLVPRQQAEWATHMLHLAATLLVRNERQHDGADLDAAQDTVQQTLTWGNKLTAPEAWSLSTVCWRYRADEFAAAGDRAGAEHAAARAVEAAAQSMVLTAPAARERPDNLIRSCNALAARYDLTGEETHRAEAIAAHREAIQSLGADTQAGQLAALNLSVVYLRHEQSAPATQKDVTEAAKRFRRVLAAAEPGERLWVDATLGLIRAHSQLFEVAPDTVDTGELMRLYRQVTEVRAVPPKRMAAAGLLTGTVLMQTGHAAAACWILTDAVRKMPTVAWRGTRRKTRESQLADLSELGCDAAASHLAAGHADPASAARAAEAVEQGTLCPEQSWIARSAPTRRPWARLPTRTARTPSASPMLATARSSSPGFRRLPARRHFPHCPAPVSTVTSSPGCSVPAAACSMPKTPRRTRSAASWPRARGRISAATASRISWPRPWAACGYGTERWKWPT